MPASHAPTASCREGAGQRFQDRPEKTSEKGGLEAKLHKLSQSTEEAAGTCRLWVLPELDGRGLSQGAGPSPPLAAFTLKPANCPGGSRRSPDFVFT